AAIARRFAADGQRVIAAARRLDKLQDLARELGDRLHPLALDVRDGAAVAAAIQSLPSAWSAIDVLVNNAGLSLGLEPAHQANMEDWERMIDTNIKGVTYLTRAILPGMVARNRGHVINIGSITAEYAYPGSHVYGGTKAFLRQFSFGLRADLLGTAVRVTVVEPGMTGETEFSNVRFAGDEPKAAKVYEGLEPLRPEDIAETVSWIASLPARVNVNLLSMMPVCQSFARPALAKKSPQP
ncbi:NAD(P)-dependent oxidoreductase, partial [Verrucomicrobia bacterium SCGC AG-212-E04]